MFDHGIDVPLLAVLGRSCGLCWRSWAALGAYVGGLGLLLGPMLTVLGRFRGLSGRSWDAFGPKLAVLGGLGAEVVGLGSDQGEKWPKPEREQDPQRVGPPEAREAPHRYISMMYTHMFFLL